jgi:hypothetical protein
VPTVLVTWLSDALFKCGKIFANGLKQFDLISLNCKKKIVLIFSGSL